MTNNVDVFICGSGSAGICAATWLARYGISCKIVDVKAGPLKVGHADGVQCRTVEIFESFGISEELLREGEHILEVTFWSSEGDKGVVRRSRTFDTAPGLSHLPHVILNQARVNGLLLDLMKKYNGQEVEYGYQVTGVEVDDKTAKDPNAYSVTVRTEKNGQEEIFYAKYALACDGAHSAVRRSLGFKMIGDSTDSVWGVMDVYPQTDFPDIRKKVVLQTEHGDVLIIPREGGAMSRFYVELPAGTSAKSVKVEDLIATTRKVFQPYKMDVAEVFWWSAFVIGQRLADHFSKDDRIFLTGDACHTHSPKAGQGMNTSLQDGYNIGWKLASILKGQVSPSLIKSYDLERGMTASDLIDFDRSFSKVFTSKARKENGTPSNFSDLFIQVGKYTAGLSVKYLDSEITWSQRSAQGLAKGITVGMRFPSAQVVRHCDARPIQLMKVLPSDGRWRIIVFPGNIVEETVAARFNKLGDFLSSEKGPIKRFTPEGAYIDSFIETLAVFSGQRIEIEQSMIHLHFWPVTGKWGIRDLHKTYVDDESYNSGHGNAYEFYGINPKEGALIIARPDQYVAAVLDIEDFISINSFFDGFAIPATNPRA